ncbi:hypothetical protein [Iodidimonas sp. SYSU 1G8]|uniref:hypothetical protein n=1 Tax=Iodidimonas sp. SYSU 1G8 TaxID=3133967 RepID=UPI0031FE6ADE
MNKLMAAAVAASLAMAGVTTPAQAQYSPRDAREMCKNAVRDRGAYDTSGINVDQIGRDKYNVTGYAQGRGGRAYFTCRVNDGRVRNVDMGNWQGGSSGNNSGAKAAAVVGAAVVLGAIAAAASSDKRHSEYDRYDEYRYRDRPSYDDRGGQYSPTPGVICYRWQRTCYKDGKGYAPNWTAREFGN